MNLYEYLGNKPTLQTDPTGLWPLSDEEKDQLYRQLTCVAFVSVMYKHCLDGANEALEACLDAANKICNRRIRERQLKLCWRIFELDAMECSTMYVAMGLCCMVFFCNPQNLAP